ncbi:hypothetical protein BGHDH14_bgh04931 [Blumeria hordei DH14]|uniref:RRM domain-containing protein n=1 Tax=Blumeria graminis f. sp. hordei (strain DH14) TaxID=546991 RepID=N1J7R4_BLUG1|nr:hypothetical protein BGHDH14_bgh04931 [Blumeria hordei DH14]
MKQVGPIKRVEISYGPGGVSRGVANITFSRADSAIKAVEECNNVAIDGRPIKVTKPSIILPRCSLYQIELILDATRAKAIPPPKGLSERVTQKPQPKSAANTKSATSTGPRGKKPTRNGRVGRNARATKKTAEELDSEMVDYWQNGSATIESNGTAAPPTNVEANMDEDILWVKRFQADFRSYGYQIEGIAIFATCITKLLS